MKIAVIGSGISGLSAASFLARRHEVTLYEQDSRHGGHTNTILVPAPTGEQPVDTGWIVYNGINYPNLTALFRELGVKTRPTSMSFGVSLGDGAYEWTGSDRLWTVFAQPSNLFRRKHLRMLLDILKLNRHCNALLRSGQLPEGSLGEFLVAAGFSPELGSRYLLPMAGLIWSCSPKKAMEYPAADFMRFFDSHSLFTATGQPVWHTVVGGSHQYLKKLLEAFPGELRPGIPVTALRRGAAGVEVVSAAGVKTYERVVCATHSDQALGLLADAAADEREVLGGIPYNASRCVLHTDESFLPRRRGAWASWNYLNDRDEVHDRPISGSYWMNLLQGIPGPVNYIVTLNPEREVPRDKVLYETLYHHPHYGAASVMTHERLPAIQGRGGLWFAGAWTGYGFHEDGLRSGLRAVAGIDRDCLPAWASLEENHRPAASSVPGLPATVAG
ncbi:FAD-dependent oxidoreductase [Solimonas sp. K1W22B-7]|uniref:NAD(P)/FAD-dependent oxidoreductase n=1 Tax=Solimonas sp. K1W22B-7 TaxID=2303331 RepID=UPI000E334734|nr:FAD-dependent oxidoreductase [Solimonas sp. K1W22B-7]AXQ27250.1 FAD-dependent oxidoreductase [Solimonas sp. K1W22B-7]